MLDPIAINQRIDQLNKHHHELAELYLKAEKDEATAKVRQEVLLSKKIMEYRTKKSNIGVDMAILWALADEDFPEREDFQRCREMYIKNHALTKGYLQLLNQVEGEKISLQSRMKIISKADGGEYYGKEKF